MRFSCSKTELLRGVQIVSKATPASTSEPIYQDLLLKASDKKLSLLGTDNRISIRQAINVTCETEGEVAVRGALFLDILQSLQTVAADEITFEADEKLKIHLTAKGASYKISGDPAKNFPHVPALEGERTFTMAAGPLKDLIRQIAVVAPSGGSPQTFEDSLLEAKDGTLTAVTTDSVRLCIKELAFDKKAELPDFDIRVPIHALVELGKILSTDDSVNVLVGDDQVAFRFAETEYLARLSDKTFPNYRQILPKEHSRTITVDTKSFTDNLKGVIPLAKENKHKVHIKFASGACVISSVTPEIGEARRELDAKVEGEDIELAFNARYILDFLSAVNAKSVELGLTSSIYPSTMKPAGDSVDYTYILMPINL